MNQAISGVRAFTIGAVITLGFTAVAAAAAGLTPDQSVGGETYNYVVRYSELDLSKMEGAIALYSRISRAARTVCQSLDSRNMDIATTYRACLRQAVAKAVAEINSPLVSQYHELHIKDNKAGQVRLAQTD